MIYINRMTEALRAQEMMTKGCTGIEVEILLFYKGRWTQLLLWIYNKLHPRVFVYEVYFLTQNLYTLLVGKLKERNHLEDSGVEGRIILERFLQI